MLYVVPVSLNYLHFLEKKFFFAVLISNSLSFRSLIHSSVLAHLLFIPSSIFHLLLYSSGLLGSLLYFVEVPPKSLYSTLKFGEIISFKS